MYLAYRLDDKALVGGVADFDLAPRVVGTRRPDLLIVVLGPHILEVLVAFMSRYKIAHLAIVDDDFEPLLVVHRLYLRPPGQ